MEIKTYFGFIMALAIFIPAWATAAPISDAVAPDITQQNILSTVCIKGYIQTERPPAYYRNELKKRHALEYVCSNMNPGNFEKNYLTQSNIAGIQYKINNSWSEPQPGVLNLNKKGRPEFVFGKLICTQKSILCGSTVHDADKMALGVQQACAWKSLASWTLIWSCRLK